MSSSGEVGRFRSATSFGKSSTIFSRMPADAHVSSGSKADLTLSNYDVRFTPESGLSNAAVECPLCARSRHRSCERENERGRYSWRHGCRHGWRYELRKGLVNLFVGVEVLTRF
jgi:hypothetical protein